MIHYFIDRIFESMHIRHEYLQCTLLHLQMYTGVSLQAGPMHIKRIDLIGQLTRYLYTCLMYMVSTLSESSKLVINWRPSLPSMFYQFLIFLHHLVHSVLLKNYLLPTFLSFLCLFVSGLWFSGQKPVALGKGPQSMVS